MLTVTAKTMQGNTWGVIDCPETTSERIEFIKNLLGSDTVIEIKASKQTVYVCCSKVALQIMETAFADKKVAILDGYETMKLIEYRPDDFLITLQCYWSPEHEKILFPPKPAKGWTPPE